jgi:hypothetical protein
VLEQQVINKFGGITCEGGQFISAWKQFPLMSLSGAFQYEIEAFTQPRLKSK